MTKQPIFMRPTSVEGAVATGARATGSSAIGAIALGAMAVGAMAIGALAIGRLAIGRAKFGRLDIGELVVGKLSIGAGTSAIVTRIRAAAGKGDALERLLLDQAKVTGSAMTSLRRSASDPDLFVHEHIVGPSESADAHDEWLATLRASIAAEDLASKDAIIVEHLQPVVPPAKTEPPVLTG